MIFATYWFLAFAILFFPIFWLCPKPALRLGLLLVVSPIFHTHYAGPAGVMPIVVMGVIVYLVGLSESRAANALGIILCVLMLVGYKYLVFFSATLLGMFHPVLEAEVSTAMRETLPEAPPLAISFLRLSSSTILWTAVAAPFRFANLSILSCLPSSSRPWWRARSSATNNFYPHCVQAWRACAHGM